MMFIKISILLISSVFVAQTRNTKRSLKPWQQVRSVNGQLDDDSNCLCFPKGQLPSVHNVLDSNNSGQERIVVYFYKTIGSNDIKMYTPNPDKQLLIPDLPYDSGDELLLVTTETVNTIFNSNSNRIKIYDNHFEKLKPDETVYWPIGLNHGAIEHIPPKVKEPINYQTNEYAYGQIGYDKLPNSNTIFRPTDETNPETGGSFWYSSNIGKPNANYQIPLVDKDKNKYPKHTTFTFMPTVDDPLNYVVFDEWFVQQLNQWKMYHGVNEIKQINFYYLRVFVEQILFNHDIHIGPDKIMKYSNGVALQPNNLELRPLFIGQKIDPELFVDKHHEMINLNKYLPFLEGILVTLVNPAQVLGVIPLAKVLLPTQPYLNITSSMGSNEFVNTLYEPYTANNMQQFNAHQSSYYNVKKRTPSYPYSKLNYDGNYNAKVGQYSSGSFADISRPTSISEQPYTSSYWSSSPNAGPPLGNVRRKLSDVKIEHHVEPPKLKNRKQLQDDRNSVPDGLDEPNEGKGGSMVANLFEPLLGKNTSASGKNFHLPSLNGVMKSLLVLLSDSRSAEEDNDDENLENLSSNDTNSTEEVDIISESEDINDGERPDYRIIGGNPATGSGTPLSNKGRSAVNDK